MLYSIFTIAMLKSNYCRQCLVVNMHTTFLLLSLILHFYVKFAKHAKKNINMKLNMLEKFTQNSETQNAKTVFPSGPTDSSHNSLEKCLLYLCYKMCNEIQACTIETSSFFLDFKLFQGCIPCTLLEIQSLTVYQPYFQLSHKYVQ